MNMVATANYDGVDSIVTKLIDLLRTYTKKPGEDWTAKTTLDEAGIDSFDIVEYIFEIEDAFDVEINFNANKADDRLETIGDFAAMIARQKATV